MNLGILVNTDRHMQQLSDIARAAIGKGHEVCIFVMDAGVHLLSSAELGRLAAIDGVEIKYCDYNALTNDIDIEAIHSDVQAGSQMDNAIMMRDLDRVIAL